MASYRYSSLPPGSESIRLLRLLPSEDEAAPLCCKLCNYSLQRSSLRTHMYEALSYVWGDPKETLPIRVDENQFRITANLHAALLRLRDHSFERIIWVDAICIDQSNMEERKNQVQLMAKIYSNAHRVVVWLGEQGVEIEGALEDIKIAANEELVKQVKKNTNQEAVVDLLRNPWFQRIWVLQEVAAARNIIIMCGSTTIDGYAFCLGRAGLRPKSTANMSGRFSLEIRSLAELIDMFYSRQATDPRDKVYALLGMSSEDPEKAALQPDYGITWEELFHQLIKFVLGADVSVETSGQRAMVKCKGCILGQVSEVKRDDRQYVNVISRNQAWRSLGDTTEWILQASENPVQKHDIVCLPHGASKPVIIRLCKDHFSIVVIAATPSNESSSLDWSKLSQSTTHSLRDLLLIWNWEDSYEKLQDEGEYETSIEIFSQVPVSSNAESTGKEYLVEAARLWNDIAILDDLGKYEATVRLSKAQSDYERRSDIKDGRSGQTPLLLAAHNGNAAVVKLLLETGKVNLEEKDREYGRTPLAWAAYYGHETIAKLLVETGKVDVDSKDIYDRTPLGHALGHGHEAIAKLLLETGKVDVNMKSTSMSGASILRSAVENGYTAIVKLLLETGKVNVHARDEWGRTPLANAVRVRNGDDIIKLLLETGKVDVDAKEVLDNLPFWYASRRHRRVVANAKILRTHLKRKEKKG
ncbi:hypothetical protein CJF30_00009696 [Rutstroemia sp. NJR-2017a BBW]|nr:hypothetical protein CJF30_00009696 [Rutstroemia sp. NJR-2017a BBW]